MDKYEMVKTIGDGAFGTVFMALTNNQNTNKQEIVAIKKIKKKFSNWDECRNLREVKSLIKLNHQNIILLKEVLKVKDELLLVFEYMAENLYQTYQSFQNENQKFSNDQIKSIFYQIASALAYMHKHGFYHRDLKPENILIHKDKVKLGDFGLAREIRSRPPFTDYVSTRWYRAPELLLKSTNYSSPVDIFALGCIVAELYNLKPLFMGNSELDQMLKICQLLGSPKKESWPEGYRQASSIGFSFPKMEKADLASHIPTACEDGISLISEMLQFDPSKRITAQQILQHPYFKNFQLNNIEINDPKPINIKELQQNGNNIDNAIRNMTNNKGATLNINNATKNNTNISSLSQYSYNNNRKENINSHNLGINAENNKTTGISQTTKLTKKNHQLDNSPKKDDAKKLYSKMATNPFSNMHQNDSTAADKSSLIDFDALEDKLKLRPSYDRVSQDLYRIINPTVHNNTNNQTQINNSNNANNNLFNTGNANPINGGQNNNNNNNRPKYISNINTKHMSYNSNGNHNNGNTNTSQNDNSNIIDTSIFDNNNNNNNKYPGSTAANHSYMREQRAPLPYSTKIPTQSGAENRIAYRTKKMHTLAPQAPGLNTSNLDRSFDNSYTQNAAERSVLLGHPIYRESNHSPSPDSDRAKQPYPSTNQVPGAPKKNDQLNNNNNPLNSLSPNIVVGQVGSNGYNLFGFDNQQPKFQHSPQKNGGFVGGNSNNNNNNNNNKQLDKNNLGSLGTDIGLNCSVYQQKIGNDERVSQRNTHNVNGDDALNELLNKNLNENSYISHNNKWASSKFTSINPSMLNPSYPVQQNCGNGGQQNILTNTTQNGNIDILDNCINNPNNFGNGPNGTSVLGHSPSFLNYNNVNTTNNMGTNNTNIPIEATAPTTTANYGARFK